jgi:hypothetical protein
MLEYSEGSDPSSRSASGVNSLFPTENDESHLTRYFFFSGIVMMMY